MATQRRPRKDRDDKTPSPRLMNCSDTASVYHGDVVRKSARSRQWSGLWSRFMFGSILTLGRLVPEIAIAQAGDSTTSICMHTLAGSGLQSAFTLLSHRKFRLGGDNYHKQVHAQTICRRRCCSGSSLLKLRSEDIDEEEEEVTFQKRDDSRFFFLRNPLSRNRERSNVFTRVPKDPSAAKCACGSKRTYDNCCQKYHLAGEAPDDPVNLIRARYSAYAYRLPGYIMRTTDAGSPDWKINQNAWERELLEFCDGYRFIKLDGETLGVDIEQCSLSGADVAFVQFRAFMLGRDLSVVELLERSRLVKKRQRWFYFAGKLLEYVGRIL